MALQYVKFFGGDIKLHTVPGHGTDVSGLQRVVCLGTFVRVFS